MTFAAAVAGRVFRAGFTYERAAFTVVFTLAVGEVRLTGTLANTCAATVTISAPIGVVRYIGFGIPIGDDADKSARTADA